MVGSPSKPPQGWCQLMSMNFGYNRTVLRGATEPNHPIENCSIHEGSAPAFAFDVWFGHPSGDGMLWIDFDELPANNRVLTKND